MSKCQKSILQTEQQLLPTYASHMWNENQAVNPKFQDKVLLPYFVFYSLALLSAKIWQLA